MEDRPQPAVDFASRRLPWLVAGGALLLYLVTLNHWVTLASLPVVAKLTGWDWWNPAVARPLLHLLTSPIRGLPAGWQIIGFSAFSAVCSSLTLALLARSVALLPHDRTRDQRQRERGENSMLSLRANWLPPLLAVLVCALQLTFWENATTATGEALDLLLFAFCVRCVLEYRLTQNISWLARLAFVYGLATAGNWAMLGFFPCFVLALVWVKGRSFFSAAFMGRMLLCGLAGLLLYLVSPLMQAGESSATFWQLLRNDLGTQKNFILQPALRSRVLLLALTSILPILLMGFRWPSSVGDASPMGVAVTNFMFRVVHAFFLVVCGWVMLDPPFSPRALGYGLPFLPFYYLSALAVGYFSGYFLLVADEPAKSTRPSIPAKAFKTITLAALWLALLLMPATLVRQNLRHIHAQNGPALRDYAAQLARDLPTSDALVMSDSPHRLLLIAAAFHGQSAAPMLLDSRWLVQLDYHRKLAKHYPGRWPAPEASAPASTPIPPPLTAHYLSTRLQTNELFYLHPSYGLSYWENLYLQPHGLVFRAQAYATNAIGPPPLSPAQVAANQKFWNEITPRLASLQSTNALDNSDAATLARWYSQALNHWGVEAQRLGLLDEAGARFSQASKLVTNPVALVNLGVNRMLRTNAPGNAINLQPQSDMFTTYRTWNGLLAACGPFDEPAFCFQLGQVHRQSGWRRQAVLEFQRSQFLNPTNLPTRLALAETFLEARLPDNAMETLASIRDTPAFAPVFKENDAPLVRLEALCHAAKTNYLLAENILLAARQRHPRDSAIADTLFQIYLQTRRLTNALASVEQQLQLTPDNPRALLNMGAVCLELGQMEQSVNVLDRLLKQDPYHLGALINHGQALMALGRLELAQRDFELLRAREPKLAAGHLGLGELALKRRNPVEALRLFKEALPLVPASSQQAALLEKKIKELQTAKP